MRLSVDVARLASLGVKGAAAGGAPRLHASAIEGFQPEGAWAADEALELQAKGSGHNEGWLLVLEAVAEELGGGSGSAGFLGRAWG